MDCSNLIAGNATARFSSASDFTPNEPSDTVHWEQNASRLAEWAEGLLNRSDAWHERDAGKVSGRLNQAILEQHFSGQRTLGIYSTSPDDETCGWAVIDIDAHGDEHDQELAELNWKFAHETFERLTAGGFACRLLDSNGAGGFHLWIKFPERLPAAIAYRFGKWLTAGTDHESFPKQPKLSGKRFGNPVRLPGRHHTRDHWTRVWDGQNWLSGQQAIDAILSLTGSGSDPNDFQPFVAWSAQQDLLEQERRSQQQADLERFAQEANAEEVASALAAISPELPYDEWVRIGMSLHTWGDASALSLWSSWSSSGAENYKPGECEQKWQTFTAGRVTLGTLFYHATAAGWVRPSTVVNDNNPLAIETIPQPAGPVRSLSDWRDEMKRNRLESLNRAGVYLDASTTGSGKGHVELDAFRSADGGVLIVPTHDNGRQERDRLQSEGINAACFPKLSEGNCGRFKEASAVQSVGLSIDQTICKGCPLLDACQYQAEKRAARAADVRIMTHDRAAIVGLSNLRAEYISIHEDPQKLLRPQWTSHQTGMRKLITALQTMLNNPGFLSSGSDHLDAQHDFVVAMVEQAERIEREQLAEHEHPHQLSLPAGLEVPAGLPWQLNRYVRRELWSGDQSLGLLLAAVSGELSTLTVSRSIALGVKHNQAPDDAVVWFNDATQDAGHLERLIGRTVQNRTPEGRLSYHTQPLQIPTDITKATKPKTVQNIVRGLVLSRPDFHRVGIICHREHVECIDQLQPIVRDRIARIEYWRSGQDVGSNAWLSDCDSLLILGTPRVPTHAVQDHLIASGRISEASESGDWSERHWQGFTKSGETLVIAGSGYRHPVWKQSHQAIVRKQMIQAIGRGRGLLADGIPVVVLSNEECGLRIADEHGLVTVSKAGGDYLQSLLTAGPMSSTQLAVQCGVTPRAVRKQLAVLIELGVIKSSGNARATRYETSGENPEPNPNRDCLGNGSGYLAPNTPPPRPPSVISGERHSTTEKTPFEDRLYRVPTADNDVYHLSKHWRFRARSRSETPTHRRESSYAADKLP